MIQPIQAQAYFFAKMQFGYSQRIKAHNSIYDVSYPIAQVSHRKMRSQIEAQE